MNKDFVLEPLKFVGKGMTWYRPTSLNDLLRLKNEHQEAKLLVGNTEIGKFCKTFPEAGKV